MADIFNMFSKWWDGAPHQASRPKNFAVKERYCDDVESFLPHELSTSSGLEALLARRPNFFSELLLLKVNSVWLLDYLDRMGDEVVVRQKDRFRLFFSSLLEAMDDNSPIRKCHALENMAVVFRSLALKSVSLYALSGSSLTDMVAPSKDQHKFFESLIFNLRKILEDETSPHGLLAAAVKLLVSLCSLSNNIDQNPVLPFFLLTQETFDALIHVLGRPAEALPKAYVVLDIAFVMAMMASYRKYESASVAHRRLEQVDSETVFANLMGALTVVMRRNNSRCLDLISEKGTFDYVKEKISGAPTVPAVTWTGWNSIDAEGRYVMGVTILVLYLFSYLNKKFLKDSLSLYTKHAESNQTDNKGTALAELGPHFVVASGLFALCPKDTSSLAATRLSLIIVRVLGEDIHSNAVIHKPALIKSAVTITTRDEVGGEIRKKKILPGESLVHLVYQMAIDYARNNLKKNFDVDTYCKIYDIVHRFMCFELAQDTRVTISWMGLVQILMVNLAFISTEEMFSMDDVPLVASKIVALLNMLVTYPDLLPSEADYDNVYYELLRGADVIERVVALVGAYTAQQKAQAAGGRKAVVFNATSIGNIKTIAVHFTKCVAGWQALNNNESPTPAQVLTIIRNGYGNLDLKLQEGLERFDYYVEVPHEANLLKQMVRTVIADAGSAFHIRPAELVDMVQTSDQPPASATTTTSARPHTVQ